MGPEATLWNWLKRGLPSLGKPHDVSRVETSAESGFPDVEGCIAGASFLVELKVAHYVRKKDGTFALDHYTAEQAYKLYRRWKVGGRSWLLIRVPTANGWTTPLHYLIAGREALLIHDDRMNLSRDRLAASSWPGFEDGLGKQVALWKAVSGPIA